MNDISKIDDLELLNFLKDGLLCAIGREGISLAILPNESFEEGLLCAIGREGVSLAILPNEFLVRHRVCEMAKHLTEVCMRIDELAELVKG